MNKLSAVVILTAVSLLMGGIAAAQCPAQECEDHTIVTAGIPFLCELDVSPESFDMGCLEVGECTEFWNIGKLFARANCPYQIMAEDNSLPPHGGCMYDPDTGAILETPLKVRLNCMGFKIMNGDPGGVPLTPTLGPTGEGGLTMPIHYIQCVTWDDVCGNYEIVVTFLIVPAP